MEERENVIDYCHHYSGSVFVSVATYHFIVCLHWQCSERFWGDKRERGEGGMQGSAIYNTGGGVRLCKGFVCVCVHVVFKGKLWLFNNGDIVIPVCVCL